MSLPKICFTLFLSCAISERLASAAVAKVLNFDDLSYEYVLTGSNYEGLVWEQGNPGYNGNIGGWRVPTQENSYPYSGFHNAMNFWGSTFIGITFPQQVDVSGAYFAAQGDVISWTSGVRVHGYRSGTEVATTAWFTDIDTHPDWFNMNLNSVDRIVLESVPTNNGGGWYGMDDFTYTIPEPASVGLLICGTAALLRRKRCSE